MSGGPGPILGYAAAAIAVALVALWIAISASALPATVASNFGFGGHARGFQSRGTCVALMTSFAVLVPFSLVQTAITSLDVSVLHALIMRANAHVPPRLDNGLGLAFIFGSVLVFGRRFRGVAGVAHRVER